MQSPQAIRRWSARPGSWREALERELAELRDDIAEAAYDYVHAENARGDGCDSRAVCEKQLRLTRLVYALDGEVPPWDSAMRIRFLMEKAADEAERDEQRRLAPVRSRDGAARVARPRRR